MSSSNSKHDKTGIIGYGNPGRQDDGIGPFFITQLAQRLPKHLSPFICLQENYQLTVEDALEACAYQHIIFVDASLNGAEPFSYQPVSTTSSSEFGSHSINPAGLMQLCQTLYQHDPESYILGIRGYQFDEFEEKLSPQARLNVEAALDFLIAKLETYYA
jgi:hydrogenase maturation protease